MKGLTRTRLATAAGLGGLLVCLMLALPSTALATTCTTTCTWTGQTVNGPGAGNWSNASNWDANGPPAANTTVTDLDFPLLSSCPSGDACGSTNDDLAGVGTGTLTIDSGASYAFTGNSPNPSSIDTLSIGSGGIQDTGTSSLGNNELELPLALTANQNWTIDSQLELIGNVTGSGTLGLTVNNSRLQIGSGLAADDEVGAVTITQGGLSSNAIVNLGVPGVGSKLNATDGNAISVNNDMIFQTEANSSVGPITLTGAALEVGDPANAATLAANSATFDPGSNLTVNITGAGTPSAGNNYSQLTSAGTVTLSGGQLAIGDENTSGGGSCQPLSVNTTYTLVQAAGVSGTFSNAPNGSTISAQCTSGTPPTFTINYTTTAVTATVLTAGSSTVSTSTAQVSANPPSPATDQADTLTTTVTASDGTTPTGTVDFQNHGQDIPGCSLEQLDLSGTATCQTSFAASTTPENLTAIYTPASGSDYSGSNSDSSPTIVTVTQASTTTTVSASNTSPSENQSVTYTATIAPQYAGSTEPSGTVAFSDGGTPISGCTSQPLTQGGSSSTATCTTSYGSPGSHSITASYGGDSNFTGSTSSAQTVTVQSPPSSGTPPPPAISATTKPADGVSSTTTTLHGTVNTDGAAVTWQFQYGESTSYNKATPVQTIAAGQTSPVAVSWKLINLTPLTVYHFRLVAITQPSSGQTPVTADGQDLTFTTQSTGSLLLTVSSLTVKGTSVFVPVKCSSKLKCTGRFSITTKAKVGKKKKLASVLCNTTFFSTKANKTTKVKAKLYGACLTLIRHASGHSIKAQFTSRPRTGQFGVIKNIVLRL